jgi:hypothetical protein
MIQTKAIELPKYDNTKLPFSYDKWVTANRQTLTEYWLSFEDEPECSFAEFCAVQFDRAKLQHWELEEEVQVQFQTWQQADSDYYGIPERGEL